MKKLAFLFGAVVVVFSLATTTVNAQPEKDNEDVTFYMPEMKVLDVVGTAPTLTFVAPENGGDAVAPVTANGSWVNYTSIVANGATNKITVSISGQVLTGTTLEVVASAPAATGNGTFGAAAAKLVLTDTDKDLVTGIGSCYTGTGTDNGRQLTYTWSVDADKYAQIKTTSGSSVTATYTIVATN